MNFINFYGRRLSHLSEKSQNLLDQVLPKYLIDVNDINNMLLKANQTHQEVNLEIGFGSGDFLSASVINNPNKFYLGVEVFLNGVSNLLEKINNKNVNNLRLYNDNVHYILDALHENMFDNIFILFPDPWPKSKHNKRRIINDNNLIIFHKILKPLGKLRFVSDHYNYVSWSLEHILGSGYFAWNVNNTIDFTQPPSDHITTKYERKALVDNSKITYCDFINKK